MLPAMKYEKVVLAVPSGSRWAMSLKCLSDFVSPMQGQLVFVLIADGLESAIDRLRLHYARPLHGPNQVPHYRGQTTHRSPSPLNLLRGMLTVKQMAFS